MIEKDPTGIGQHEPGAKLDAGKPRMELLQDFGLAIEALVKVATFGANKYADGGWTHVPNGVARYTGAMLRHLFKEKYEPLDKDCKLPHAYQTAWNAMARLELMLREEAKNKPKDLSHSDMCDMDKAFNQK